MARAASSVAEMPPVEHQGRKFRNRIVGSGEERPEDLLANPKNWRVHPKFQQDVLEGVLADVGWVQDIIVNRVTGHVVDGHLRVALAMRRDEPLVPVKYVELSPEEEEKILLTIDPIGALATTDTLKLGELIKDVQPGIDNTAVQALVDRLNEQVQEVLEKEQTTAEAVEASDRSAGIYALREDALFPANNEWGIPELLPDMLSAQVPEAVWDGNKERADETMFYLHTKGPFPESAKGGVLGFYIDDYKFERVWTDAVGFGVEAQEFGWGSLVAPDFSIWQDDPLAIQVYNLYRGQWVARYWQEMGLRVIPNIGYVSPETHLWQMAVVPKKAPVVACQCRTTRSRLGQDHFAKGLALQVEELQPENVLIYGGYEHRDWIETRMPKGPIYHYLVSWGEVRRKPQKQKVLRSA